MEEVQLTKAFGQSNMRDDIIIKYRKWLRKWLADDNQLVWIFTAILRYIYKRILGIVL
jgi:hypothetical protein